MPRRSSELDVMEPPSKVAVKGRPRKTTTDTEAIERRRTQLRVAQRAFRKRREATIDELRSEVSKLQEHHDDLLNAVRGFAQRAVQRGLADDLAVDLLAILNRHNETRSESQGDDTSDSPSTVPHTSNHRQVLRTIESGGRSPNDEYTDSSIEDVMREPLHDDLSTSFGQPQHANTHLIQQSTQQIAQARYMSPRSDRLPSLLQHKLNTATTVNFDDLSFGMRLRRRGLETGYQLASNRWQAPAAYQRAFGRRIRTRGDSEATIIHFLHDRLMTPPQESQWFMRQNINWANVEDPENPALQDVFFFPADVEAYLAKRGITIDNGAWFVSAKMKRKLLIAGAKAPLLEPFHQDLLNKCAGPAYQYVANTLSPPSTSLTPSAASAGESNMYTNSSTSQAYLPMAESATQQALFQIEDFDWMSQDMLPNVDDFDINNLNNNKSDQEFYAASTLSHEEAYFLEPPQISKHDPYASLNYLPDFLDSAPSSTPSFVTGPTDSDQTDSEDALVDVTLDITQLIQNLLVSIECLGDVQGIMKADVDRALRASVLEFQRA